MSARRWFERFDDVGRTRDVWKPSGIVTLLSDFGLDDPYVGTLKGVLLGRHRAAIVVDLTHAVPPQDVRVGGWLLARSIDAFPAGTVHVAVVDPGVGSARRLLVAEDRGHAFLAPDNGLLSAALSPEASIRELDVARFARANASRTFHGRDVLAPAAADLCAGLLPRDAGKPLAEEPVEVAPIAPIARAGARREEALEAEVLFADRYGNLVLGATPADLAGGTERWVVEVGGLALALSGTYADVRPGEPLALVDSFGALEVAVRDGSAARRFGLAAGARVTLRRRG